MSRHRRFLVLSFAAVVLGLVVGVWLLLPRTAITRENAYCIEPGMTLEQVQLVMGGPPRDESTGPLVFEGPGEIVSGDTDTDRVVMRPDLSGDVVHKLQPVPPNVAPGRRREHTAISTPNRP